MSKLDELFELIREWERTVKEQGVYSDAELLNGVNEMIENKKYNRAIFDVLLDIRSSIIEIKVFCYMILAVVVFIAVFMFIGGL